ncbi:replication protein [Anopheles sinensis]|uniref:Replication protein n=1 Tax=Anopheles sinensis TaxID=74873 RepID=A0A084VZ26_ANOSI|nr:replication protein [Anopheles sinensis]
MPMPAHLLLLMLLHWHTVLLLGWGWYCQVRLLRRAQKISYMPQQTGLLRPLHLTGRPRSNRFDEPVRTIVVHSWCIPFRVSITCMGVPPFVNVCMGKEPPPSKPLQIKLARTFHTHANVDAYRDAPFRELMQE